VLVLVAITALVLVVAAAEIDARGGFHPRVVGIEFGPGHNALIALVLFVFVAGVLGLRRIVTKRRDDVDMHEALRR
jgi:hypothetical protein